VPAALLHPRPQCLATPVDHARALHPAGRGRVTLARRFDGRWRETSLPIADLGYAVRQLAGEPDVYLTQNRFLGRRRLVSRLAELDALFVDLDYHKTTHADAHPRHVLDLALDTLQAERIPSPSFAVASGRGLAVVWLHHPVPRAALPRWRACQRALWHALRHLGADRLAGDAARVLRVVGTRHGGTRTLVEAITPVGEVWDFDPLADEILPLPRAELVALSLERAKRRTVGQGAPSLAHWFTSAGLWELRLAELQQLLRHRWLGTLPSGQRDLWMLLAGTAMSYLVPGPMVRRETVALADEVTGGRWRERETLARMGAVIARAERAARGEKVEHRGRLVDPRYRFRTDTVVELLGVTEAEMGACGLRHLVSPEIRRELHRLGEERRRRALGMVARQEYEAGSASRLEPWEAEGISRRTWYRRHGTSPCRCMVGEALADGLLSSGEDGANRP
jgi:hypothetical protein